MSTLDFLNNLLSLSGQNNPFSGRPFQQGQGIGLTGLDPKFISDPRFDYQQKLVQNRHPSTDNPNPWLVLMGNHDDYDSAPIGVKSTLAVDEPLGKIQAEMENKAIGPSPWFMQNTRDISQGRPITHAMAQMMLDRILNTRDRIEDRY